MKTFFVEIESKPQMLNKKIESLCGELKQVIKEHEYFYRLKGMSQTDKSKHKNTIAYLINTYSILKAANTMLLSAIINDMNDSRAQAVAIEKHFKRFRYPIEKRRDGWLATKFSCQRSNQGSARKKPYDETNKKLSKHQQNDECVKCCDACIRYLDRNDKGNFRPLHESF